MEPNYPSPWDPDPESDPKTNKNINPNVDVGSNAGPHVDAEDPFQIPEPKTNVWKTILQGMGVAGLVVSGAALLVTLVGLGIYAYYASKLPSPQELYQRTTSFKSTKIMDRNGKVLFEVFDPTGGRRTVVHFDDIAEVAIQATVATEDRTFFYNPGINPYAIVRALVMNLKAGEVVSGASTITQQLVKNLFLTREETVTRKVQEAILATEITRRYSKSEILEVYLNEVYYGNLAYGIGAAAETYFGKEPGELNLSEAALLAGLIQSPALYDPYIDPDAALARRDTVLRLMVTNGYITRDQANEATQQPLGIIPQTITMEAPHLVMDVRQELERRYGTEVLYKGGLQVYTTLDLDLQHEAERVAQENIAALRDRNASNAALVAIDPSNGDILAMLGSVDFYDTDMGGQVNVARRLRQPGSTMKVFTYLSAMERGWTAATMLMDVAQSFPDGANPPYRPTNYDGKEYGPITLRTALACSRNIPAVSTLQQIGLPALLEMAQRLGITSLTRPDYGLSLTLGGGEVTLVEMTGAYATIANGGRRVTPRMILRIEDTDGNVLWEEPAGDNAQLVDERIAYVMTDILADDEARIPSFGQNSPLKLSFPAAAKTGTTNDYRDSWTVGYTPGLVTGVWVGNNDNSVMDSLSGARGAALIWHDFMESVLAGQPIEEFTRPQGVVEVEVCALSGLKRTERCPEGRVELFPADKVPQQECTVHAHVKICKVSGQLASQYCPVDSLEERDYMDFGAAFDEWAHAQGYNTPPRATCTAHSAPSNVRIQAPSSPLSGMIEVRGSTDVPDFRHYYVEYGVSDAPGAWGRLTQEIGATVIDGALCRWDTTTVEDGVYSLRVVAVSNQGVQTEARVVVEVRNATPTPDVTQTPTETPTPGITESPTPTWTPSPTWEPSRTPPGHGRPTETPTPSPTVSPEVTPTIEPDVTTLPPPPPAGAEGQVPE
ncbi:MAG: transglycosylase domain-containing protein [Anaerolineae bacterium]